MNKIALLFAGQGAQYSGMGKELYDTRDAAREIFDECDRISNGNSVMCFSGSREELSETINTQPALYAVDLAIASTVREELEKKNLEISSVAGFSLGETAAAAFAGVYSIADGFKFVLERARAMDICAKKSPGSMAAVLRLSNESVGEICKRFSSVFPVNYNCPGQVSVAGAVDEMPLFTEAVTAAGGKAIMLAVSGAFHSPFMDSASEVLREYLKNVKIEAPIIPLYSNKTAGLYDKNGADLLASQVNNPVRWEMLIKNMISNGTDCFIEVGPGKVLSGFVKKISTEVKIFNVENTETLNNLSASIL